MTERLRSQTLGGCVTGLSSWLFLAALLLGCSTEKAQKSQTGTTSIMAQPMAEQNTTRPHLNLSLLKDRIAICRLSPTDKVPSWACADASFSSVTRTKDELSIVCPEAVVPKDIKQEAGWRVFKVAGPLDFALTGILASMADPLAKAGVSIFTISTFDTDYLMVKEEKLEVALNALRDAGHNIHVE